MLARKTWRLVSFPNCSTLKEAVQQQKEKGLWKRPDKGSSGDYERHAYLQCNAHVGCQVQRRISAKAGGDSEICIAVHETGTHTTAPQEKRRGNASMTYKQEEFVKRGVNMGVRPARILTELTQLRFEELEAAGYDPDDFKKEKGGLKGALQY